MRSDLVFGAHALVPNRFLLCKLAAKATRAFHRPGTRIHDTTNDVLERFSHAKSIADVQPPHEREVPQVRRQKTAPIQHAPIRPAPARISRGDQASIELGRIWGYSPTHVDAEPVLKPGVPTAAKGLLFPDVGKVGQ
jgi:hypothetical protein